MCEVICTRTILEFKIIVVRALNLNFPLKYCSLVMLQVGNEADHVLIIVQHIHI